MAKLPKEVKIGNRTIPIEREELMANPLGYYDPLNLRIVIDSSLSGTQMVETFWHEIVHAVFDYIRFGFEMAKEMDDKDTPETDAYKIEEYAAESFAKTFLQMMQDNPKLATLTE